MLTSQTQDCGVFQRGDHISGGAGVVPYAFFTQPLYDVHRAGHLRLIAVELPAEDRRWDGLCRAPKSHSLAKRRRCWSYNGYVMRSVCVEKHCIFLKKGFYNAL